MIGYYGDSYPSSRRFRDISEAISKAAKPPKASIDEMTPEQAAKRKAARIKQLRESIKRYRKHIADAEAEIKQWESL